MSLKQPLSPLGVSGELGVLVRAISSLLAGGYLGCAHASAVLAHIIRPLVTTASRWLPAGGYLFFFFLNGLVLGLPTLGGHVRGWLPRAVPAHVRTAQKGTWRGRPAEQIIIAAMTQDGQNRTSPGLTAQRNPSERYATLVRTSVTSSKLLNLVLQLQNILLLHCHGTLLHLRRLYAHASQPQWRHYTLVGESLAMAC